MFLSKLLRWFRFLLKNLYPNHNKYSIFKLNKTFQLNCKQLQILKSQSLLLRNQLVLNWQTKLIPLKKSSLHFSWKIFLYFLLHYFLNGRWKYFSWNLVRSSLAFLVCWLFMSVGNSLLMLPFPSVLIICRYASLYFCCAIEQSDNELVTLEVIHRYVELLDKYFGSVRFMSVYLWINGQQN